MTPEMMQAALRDAMAEARHDGGVAMRKVTRWMMGTKVYASLVFNRVLPPDEAAMVAKHLEKVGALVETNEALVRALLAVEWRPIEGLDGVRYCAGACGNTPERGHDANCPVDAALRQAGLETQQQRDAAREEMGR